MNLHPYRKKSCSFQKGDDGSEEDSDSDGVDGICNCSKNLAAVLGCSFQEGGGGDDGEEGEGGQDNEGCEGEDGEEQGPEETEEEAPAEEGAGEGEEGPGDGE